MAHNIWETKILGLNTIQNMYFEFQNNNYKNLPVYTKTPEIIIHAY